MGTSFHLSSFCTIPWGPVFVLPCLSPPYLLWMHPFQSIRTKIMMYLTPRMTSHILKLNMAKIEILNHQAMPNTSFSNIADNIAIPAITKVSSLIWRSHSPHNQTLSRSFRYFLHNVSNMQPFLLSVLFSRL